MAEAFVFVTCFLAMVNTVESLAKMTEGVSGAYATTGIYDLVLKIKVPDDNLKEVLQKIKRIPGVASTITSIITK